MSEMQTFFFEADRYQVYSYKLGEEALIFQPPGRKEMVVPWEQIRYLEDVSGRKVNIVLNDTAVIIPVYYAMDKFSDLLETVCSRLAQVHQTQIGVQTFQSDRTYQVHRGIVLGFFALLVLVAIFHFNHFPWVGLFVTVATLPMVLYIILQPHTVIPTEDALVVRDLIRQREISYGHVARMGFDLHGDAADAYLCIRIHLTKGRQIKIQRLENLILLFIFITSKRTQNEMKTAGRVSQP